MTPEMKERARLQRLALSTIGYMESDKLQNPKAESTRTPDPYPTTTQPISGKVWKLVQDIKKLPQNNRTGYPMRNELCNIKEHFLSNGTLKGTSELYQYSGNTTMFSQQVWRYLIAPQ